MLQNTHSDPFPHPALIWSFRRSDFIIQGRTLFEKKSFGESFDKPWPDYLDLFLIHRPGPTTFRGRKQQANAEIRKAMAELVGAGRITVIGVCSFLPHHPDELAGTARIALQIHRIRLCPGDTQDGIAAYCRERGTMTYRIFQLN